MSVPMSWVTRLGEQASCLFNAYTGKMPVLPVEANQAKHIMSVPMCDLI